LERLLRARRIDPRDVVHVGNGSNDVPVFRHVGAGIAVNPMNDGVRSAARASVEPLRDLGEVADLILSWSGR
ncbi:MAG TPA: HAD hydrolase family protein, partial [Candidatus Thermoplasmatota archaeon]|nr:HAD hydrolase family protein [Candidatus Thermoplasmatota archaeon]